MKEIVKSSKGLALINHGYVLLEHDPSLLIHIQNLMMAWKGFWSQNLKHKEGFFFEKNGGYEYKDETQPDYKENFHVSLAYDPPKDIETSIDVQFLFCAKKLILESELLVRDIASIMGQGSKFDLEKLVLDDMQTWQLRCLHYPPRPENLGKPFLAIPHIDKGITIHFAEDRPGLEVYWHDKWQEADMMANHVLSYPGMLGQYYSECRFPALDHRVRSLPDTCRYGRDSIVMFIDFGDVRYNKKEFGSTQERFPNGENYNMSFSEFEKYFSAIGIRN